MKRRTHLTWRAYEFLSMHAKGGATWEGRGDGWGRTGGRGPVAPRQAAWSRSTPCSPPHSTPPRLLRVVPHQPCCSACVGKMAKGGGGGGEAMVEDGIGE